MNEGRKILVSYGNENYYNSLKRLESMAINTSLFDEIRMYTDKDLPEYIKNHELMKYQKGGGYWIWKPWCILDTLIKSNENDIIIYSDCGNEIYNHKEWKSFWHELQASDIILFRYGAIMKHWCRKDLLDYFKYHKNVNYIHELYQIQSGLIIVKKNAEMLIREWFKIMFSIPHFAIDICHEERDSQYKGFIEHRHDQAILSCVAYSMIKTMRICILWQHSEFKDKNGQAVFNARISDNNRRSKDNVYEPIWKKILKLFILTPYRNFKTYVYIHL